MREEPTGIIVALLAGVGLFLASIAPVQATSKGAVVTPHIEGYSSGKWTVLQ